MENPDLVLQETGSRPTYSRLNYVPSGDTLRRDAISSYITFLESETLQVAFYSVKFFLCQLMCKINGSTILRLKLHFSRILEIMLKKLLQINNIACIILYLGIILDGLI